MARFKELKVFLTDLVAELVMNEIPRNYRIAGKFDSY